MNIFHYSKLALVVVAIFLLPPHLTFAQNNNGSNCKNLGPVASFSYKYNPDTTKMIAVECGEKYIAPNEPLIIKSVLTYRQPWSGFIPASNMSPESAKLLPAQTANIKGNMIYDGIEVIGNKWMRMACDEATHSVRVGQDAFGTVIVQIDDDSNEVIRYWKNHNHATEWFDPTAHAEMTTIRAACKQLGVISLAKIRKEDPNLKLPQKGVTSHCELYTSKEPCPMCYMAMRKSGINFLYFAATRFDGAVQGLPYQDDVLYKEFCTPYKYRAKFGMHVYQCTVDNSLDALNLFKRLKH